MLHLLYKIFNYTSLWSLDSRFFKYFIKGDEFLLMLLPFMKEKKLKDEKSLDPLKSRSSVYGSAPFHFTTLWCSWKRVLQHKIFVTFGFKILDMDKHLFILLLWCSWKRVLQQEIFVTSRFKIPDDLSFGPCFWLIGRSY